VGKNLNNFLHSHPLEEMSVAKLFLLTISIQRYIYVWGDIEVLGVKIVAKVEGGLNSMGIFGKELE